MHFNLQNWRLYLCILDDVNNFDTPDIAYSDIANKSILDQSLHGLPSLLVGYTQLDFHSWVFSFGIMDPFRRVSYFRVYVLEWNWEVDQVEIDVVNTEVFKSSLAGSFHMLGLVECVPKFRYDEEFFPLDNTFADCSLDALTCLFLITIVACWVKKSVPNFDSIVNCLSCYILGNFPKTKTSLRHFVTWVQN